MVQYSAFCTVVPIFRASEDLSDLPWIADQLRLLSRKIDRIPGRVKDGGRIQLRPLEQERDFRYSPCFRSIQIDRKLYHLTSQQAEILRILYANWMQGTTDVSVAFLLETLSDQGFSACRLKDLFQKDKDLFKDLIRPGVRRGTVRLRLAARD